MRHSVRTMMAAATIGLFAMSGAVPVSASADDQARLDAAIDAFDQRMTDAGWVGTPAEDDDDDEEEGDDDEISVGDEQFAECLGELAVMFEDDVDVDEFPGQVASRESLEFTFTPPSEGAPETTEAFSFDLGQEEGAGAFAVTVDEANAELLDTFVDVIGAESTGDCLTEAINAEMAAEESEDFPMELDLVVENEGDLGIGDRSARMGFGFSTNIFGMSIQFEINMLMARVDRDLVMVMHSLVGADESLSGFDPAEELQLIVDSLN